VFGAKAGQPNSCGIHIHEGTSCAENALGHYWNKTTHTADAWSSISYRWGWWQLWSVPVRTGFESTDVSGHALIVHDYEGKRVGCGIVSPYAEVANAFVPYYTYKGDLVATGWVQVLGRGVLLEASQELSWSLEGVDPACGTAPGAGANPNACGIHIHQGMDCTSNAMGHYFSSGIPADPWTAVKYTTNDHGSSAAHGVTVTTGLSNHDVLGHTMIVHDSKGGRIACGVLVIASP